MKDKCLVTGCEKEEWIRGLCTIHYRYAVGLVNKKKTSWKELENKGKVKPKKKAGRSPSAAALFFLE